MGIKLMVADPTRPLLKLKVPSKSESRQKRNSNIKPPKPRSFSPSEQSERFSEIFQKVNLLDGAELKADPTALAPERLIVFELSGSVSSFAKAINHIDGLYLLDIEELEATEDDEKPTVYLLMPNMKALQKILSLWSRWEKGETKFEKGLAGWRDVFATLLKVRPWGPQDRVDPTDIENLKFDLTYGKENIRVEIELVFQPHEETANLALATVTSLIEEKGGAVLSTLRLEDIRYHGILAELPPQEVLNITKQKHEGIVNLDEVMFIRTQSTVNTLSVEDVGEGTVIPPMTLKGPIAALLDGVPVSSHALLGNHLIVNDILEFEDNVLAKDREHGTAMASLIIHGDRNAKPPSSPLPRKIVLVPVFDKGDELPTDKLVVDVVYQALQSLIAEDDDNLRDILIVNLSLGIATRRFQGRMSPLARLIDRFSVQYGILCIVSAGNITESFDVPKKESIEVPLLHNGNNVDALERSKEILSAIDGLKAQRRLLSPAETVNGLTVGARNYDAIDDSERNNVADNIFIKADPYGKIHMSNVSSALGPGYGNSIKPDFLMPGSKERLLIDISKKPNISKITKATKQAGLLVAAADGTIENAVGWTSGTSAAAALASRTAHRIHDALEEAYGEEFTDLPKIQRASLLKALLVHSARWPCESAEFIKSVVGPFDNNQHTRQKDNIRRYIGYGMVDEDFAVSCSTDRATFWATGALGVDQKTHVRLPIPQCFGNQKRNHSITATLAWFTPVNIAHSAYGSVRFSLLDPAEQKELAIDNKGNQPDANQIKKGTVISRRFQGEKIATVGEKMFMNISVQREPDKGAKLDESVAFGLAISIEMPGEDKIYEQVKQMLEVDVAIPQSLPLL